MERLRDIMRQADNTNVPTAEVKEALNLLYELALEKAKTFEREIDDSLKIDSSGESPTFPVSMKLASRYIMRNTTEQKINEGIIPKIMEILVTIINGAEENIISGIAKLINMGLSTVTKAAAVGEAIPLQEFYIVREGSEIIRIDLIYWCRSITAPAIMKYGEKTIVCTVVKSGVDLSKIDYNAFLSSYSAQLVRCAFSNEELQEEIAEISKIYSVFTSS